MNGSGADSDVIVVGAGIGGAVLGLSLGSRGWKVKLLEREAQPPRIARPEILWGDTPKALDRFGVGSVIRDRVSVRITGIEATRGVKPLLTVSPSDLERAGVEPFSTDPSLSRAAILEAALASGNVTVVRGAEVQQVVTGAGPHVVVRGKRADGPFEERARLIVGDDGVHSRVRESLAIPLDAKLFPVDFVTAAIRWPDELAADRVKIFMKPAAFRSGVPAMGLMPWPGGRGALLIPLVHDRVERMFQAEAASFWESLKSLTPVAGRLQEQLRFPDDFTRVRRPYGHAARYVADRAAIIGDAAHPMSPAGGQGANASIWDALALADVAHEGLLADDLSERWLSRYEVKRRPANARSVRFSTRGAGAFAVLGHAPGLRWLVPALLRLIDVVPPLKRSVLSAAATTFVTR